MESTFTRGGVRIGARAAAAAALVLALLGIAASGAAAKKIEVEIVSQTGPVGTVPPNTKYFKTIQEAVNASKKGVFILIEPGVYKEEVKVTKKHKGIFIRGMNRNSVIVAGEGIKGPAGKGANGIEVVQTDNVWVENLTVRNFEREALNGPGGNEIWWNGSSESPSKSEKVNAHGWYGKYLTAYDTGLDGGYGIFTSHETEGEWENIYASGFNDSGIYIGACEECKAKVVKATMEYNALGYSGSNSGGNLVIEDSRFAHNTTGIAPNSENPGDAPPPENGACEHSPPVKRKKGKLGPKIEEELPKFTKTDFAHCEIIRDNEIVENNDLDLPANTSAAAAPWGAGVELPGDYGDLVEGNKIERNPSDGVLAFEYPNPYPPVEGETIYFQNAGNEVSNNVFHENGSLSKTPAYEGSPYTGDVAFEGGFFGSHNSTMDCLSGNSFEDPTFPAEIETTWGCQNETTPNPGGGFPFIDYLLKLQEESEHRPMIEPVAAPPEQETMPNPCEKVPNNPLCENGKPAARRRS